MRRTLAPAAAVLLTLSALAATAPAAAAPSGGSMTALVRHVYADVNLIRADHGLRPLRPSVALSSAAEQHSREMALLGYFSHNSVDGSPFYLRIERFYGPRGYRSWAVGENLVWASPSLSTATALGEWMASPRHRANLLARRWRDVGIAAVWVPATGGAFQGRHGVTLLTADFGFRKR